MIYSWTVKEMAAEHTKFLTELLATTQGITPATVEYLCRHVFLHAWKHAEEELLPKRSRDGKFVEREY